MDFWEQCAQQFLISQEILYETLSVHGRFQLHDNSLYENESLSTDRIAAMIESGVPLSPQQAAGMCAFPIPYAIKVFAQIFEEKMYEQQNGLLSAAINTDSVSPANRRKI